MVCAVHGDGCPDLNRIGVVRRIVDGFDNLLLRCTRHEGGFDAVAVAVVFVCGNDVVVNGVGLGARIGFAALLGKVAFGVVGERRFMAHGVNLPDWAVVCGLVGRLPLADNSGAAPLVRSSQLFPFRGVAHLTVVIWI